MSYLFLLSFCLSIIVVSSSLENKNLTPNKLALENIVNKLNVETPNSAHLETLKISESSNTHFQMTAERVDEINNGKKKWKAKLHSRFANRTPKELRRFLGIKRIPSAEHRTKREEKLKSLKTLKKAENKNYLKNENKSEQLPKEFDARNEWPECADMIDIIQDQSACGSCWAVSSASVMQDRICISSGGELKLNISSEDILSCEKQSYGCDGGWPENAFEFWKTKGVCTGSAYEEHEGCKPYPIPPNPDKFYSTPRCKRRCENRKYKTKYNNDKHYGKEPVNLQNSEDVDIMNAIIEGGPVEADMIVYYDFLLYSKGIYEADEYSQEAGGHAVRIIGWGYHNESDTPYWLVANSWGKEWGIDGYFKIARAQDECFIESWGVNYADPALSNNTLTSPGAISASKRRQERIEQIQRQNIFKKNLKN